MIGKKFITGDFVIDTICCTKFGANLSCIEKITDMILMVLLFFSMLI